MPAATFLPPSGWDGVATTLAELRANYSELGDFLDRQWDEIESLRGALDKRASDLDERERELDRKDEEIVANLELAEVYKQLAEARCDLLRHSGSASREHEEALTAAWSRIEELEKRSYRCTNREKRHAAAAAGDCQSGEPCSASAQ